MGRRPDTLTAPSLLPWLEAVAGGYRLRIHVQPDAARGGVAGRHGDALKLGIAAAAVEGVANEIEYLARRLNLSRREVTIAQGEKSRRMIVRVPLDPAKVERYLEMRAPET